MDMNNNKAEIFINSDYALANSPKARQEYYRKIKEIEIRSTENYYQAQWQLTHTVSVMGTIALLAGISLIIWGLYLKKKYNTVLFDKGTYLIPSLLTIVFSIIVLAALSVNLTNKNTAYQRLSNPEYYAFTEYIYGR